MNRIRAIDVDSSTLTSKHSTRAGQYEKQSNGYLAFIPAPLPPNPRIRFTSTLLDALDQAKLSLNRLNGSILTLPKIDTYVEMYLRHEAVLSNRIDGINFSLLDLLAAEARIPSSKHSIDLQEIQHYIVGMKQGFGQIDIADSYSSCTRQLHKTILQHKNETNLDLGEFRTKQSWIGSAGCSIHEANFVPPPPENIQTQMQELDQFVANDDEIPTLVKIGLIHSQFENIHPFLNGNGRVNRLSMALLLYNGKVVEKPVLNLSWYFSRHEQEYQDRLQAVREEGNWEEWMIFFLRAVAQVGKYSAITLRRIFDSQEENRSLINYHLGRSVSNGHRVLDRLYEFPFISVNEVCELTGTTFAAANALVMRLVNCGVLGEFTQHRRNRRYLLYNYVELFKES